MTDLALTRRVRLPSVDEVLRYELCLAATQRFGPQATVAATRRTLEQLRSRGRTGAVVSVPNGVIAAEVTHRLEASDARRLRRVFNLTGTVLHTNLGRALLPEEATFLGQLDRLHVDAATVP